MKITANMIGYVASPIIAGAIAFGGFQYTKGQDDLILETMKAKLELIDVSNLEAMKTKLALIDEPRLALALDKLDRINITILDQRIDKLGQIDLADLRELREDLDELDEEIEEELEKINADLGADFQEIVNIRNDINILKEKLEKLESFSGN